MQVSVQYKPTEYKLEDTVFYCTSDLTEEREDTQNFMTFSGVQEYQVTYKVCAVCGAQVDESGHVL